MHLKGDSDKVIYVKDLHKYFGKLEVLKGIDCHIGKGECVCVIGASGSGKSTFLRCLNLLETPTKGEIIIGGTNLMDKNLDVDDLRKRVGMVFQHFNLFPHLTILENVTLAPIRHKMYSEKEAREKAMELLNRVGVGDKADNYPAQLSEDKNSVWRLPDLWHFHRKLCCLMSQHPHWIRRWLEKYWKL